MLQGELFNKINMQELWIMCSIKPEDVARVRTSTSFWEREGFAGLGMWRVRMVQSEQHMICRLTASGGQGGPSKHGRNWQRKTAVSGSSPQLTLKKGAPGDQVWDLLCVQLASYLERGPLMWMMPLHLHVNQKSDYDDDVHDKSSECVLQMYKVLSKYHLWFSSYRADTILWRTDRQTYGRRKGKAICLPTRPQGET